MLRLKTNNNKLQKMIHFSFLKKLRHAYLTDFKSGGGGAKQYLESCVYSFIEGTPVILVLHQFHTPTEKMLTLGSIIISPLLC